MQARSSFGVRRWWRSALAVALLCGAGAAVSAGFAPAFAATPINPPNCAAGAADCFKEIRIVNNTEGTIYPIIQGSKQLTEALGGCVTGDIWLQRALNDTKNCYKVNSNYYVYVNPKTGIKKGETVSVKLPWWSKLDRRRRPNADTYVDWWRGGRIYFFDDQQALFDSYRVNGGRKGEPIAYASGSPQVTCNTAFANACLATELTAVRVQDNVLGSTVENKSPFQLNEWTFGDVLSVSNGGTLIGLNLNYNVSNVDQLYLPVAMEPIKPGYDVGYMGTIMTVADWRARLVGFTGANAAQTNATKWPIYNNPINPTTRKKRYPNAGIRVPSALALINFYMEPAYIDGDVNNPEMIPLPKPYDRNALPVRVKAMMQNWVNCTTAPYTNCPLHEWYTPIKTSFDTSYKAYLAKCWDPAKSPQWMKPEAGGLPKLETYLRFVHGWVPFRVDQVAGRACSNVDVPDLPLTKQPPSELGYAPVNYMKLQYDWDQMGATGAQIFNPYTMLMHGAVSANFLDTSAYAFSIDDHESFQNHPGTGIIFAIGGPNGLPNKTKVPSRVPPFYEWYTAAFTPAQPDANGVGWKAYGVCNADGKATHRFPNRNADTIGIDPRTAKLPCLITLEDEKGRLYQLKISKFNTTGSRPYQIWPQFTPTGEKPFDPTVVSCPNPNDDWCKYTNERALLVDPLKPNGAPTFTLSARGTKP